MKRIYTLLIIVAAACTANAQSPAELFDAGNKAYKAGQYAEASAHYEAALSQGQENAAIYYNLGDSYYRQGELALAILNFERAKRLAPTDNDIQENLDFVYSKTQDKIQPVPRLFFIDWWYNINTTMSPRGWINCCIILMFLMCAGIAVFFLSKDYAWRKISLIISCCLICLLILGGANAISSAHYATAHDEAIVTSPMSVVKSSPDLSSVDKFVLHEGTKVKIDDEVDGWYKITIADGNKGWTSSDELTII